jgi:hypothetical protein
MSRSAGPIEAAICRGQGLEVRIILGQIVWVPWPVWRESIPEQFPLIGEVINLLTGGLPNLTPARGASLRASPMPPDLPYFFGPRLA